MRDCRLGRHEDNPCREEPPEGGAERPPIPPDLAPHPGAAPGARPRKATRQLHDELCHPHQPRHFLTIATGGQLALPFVTRDEPVEAGIEGSFARGREMAALGRPAPYDEVETLDRLLTSIECGEVIGGIEAETRPTLVVVRPHPRDIADKFDAVIANRKARVIVSAAGTPSEAIMAADLSAGMYSMLLREAKALGRPVVSLVGIEI